MKYATPYNDTYQMISPLAAFTKITESTGARHSKNILQLWDDVELAIHGVYRVDEVDENYAAYSREDSVSWTPIDNRVTRTTHWVLKDLPQIIAMKSNEVEKLYNTVKSGGVVVGPQNLSFPTDIDSLILYQFLESRYKINPYPDNGLTLQLLNGQIVRQDQSQFQVLLDAVADHLDNANTRRGELLEEIESWAGTQQELVDLDLSSGWSSSLVVEPSDPRLTR